MTHDDLIRRGYALAVTLVALGVALAVACVKELRPWRWT